MIQIKILLLFIGIVGTIGEYDNNIEKIPIIGPVIGVVEDAVNSTADILKEEIEPKAIITEEKIKEAVNKFKELMSAKIDLLGLPRLEPLEIKVPIDINIDHEIGIFKGALNNVKIKHLSTFDPKDIEVHGIIIPNGIDLTMFIKDIDISGNYDIDGIAGDLFHIFGKGPFHIIVHDINAIVKIKKIKLTNFLQHVQFEEINVNVSIGAFTSDFTNLMGGGEPEELFNKLISELAPEAVEVLWPEIEPGLTTNIKKIVNKKLLEVTIKQLTDLLSGKL